MGKKRTANQQLKIESEAVLLYKLSSWTVNRLVEDFGIDFVVQLAQIDKSVERNGQKASTDRKPSREMTALSFFIQLKASHNFEGDEFIRREFSTDFVKSYWKSPVPVVVVYYEKSSGFLYWRCLQEFLWDKVMDDRPTWWNQESIQIEVSRDNKIADIDEFGKQIEQISNRIQDRHVRDRQLGYFDEIVENVIKPHHLSLMLFGLIHEAMEAEDSETVLRARLEKLKALIVTTAIPEDYLITKRESPNPTYLFKLYDVCDRAMGLCEGYDEELNEYYEELATEIYYEIYHIMVGNRYLNCRINEEFYIVDISDLGPPGMGGMWMAEQQYLDGIPWDQSASAIAQRMDYQLTNYAFIEEDKVALHNSCGENNHEFEVSETDEQFHNKIAICSDCGLSNRTIAECISGEQEPVFCEECGDLVMEYSFYRDRCLCDSCLD